MVTPWAMQSGALRLTHNYQELAATAMVRAWIPTSQGSAKPTRPPTVVSSTTAEEHMQPTHRAPLNHIALVREVHCWVPEDIS